MTENKTMPVSVRRAVSGIEQKRSPGRVLTWKPGKAGKFYDPRTGGIVGSRSVYAKRLREVFPCRH